MTTVIFRAGWVEASWASRRWRYCTANSLARTSVAGRGSQTSPPGREVDAVCTRPQSSSGRVFSSFVSSSASSSDDADEPTPESSTGDGGPSASGFLPTCSGRPYTLSPFENASTPAFHMIRGVVANRATGNLIRHWVRMFCAVKGSGGVLGVEARRANSLGVLSGVRRSSEMERVTGGEGSVEVAAGKVGGRRERV